MSARVKVSHDKEVIQHPKIQVTFHDGYGSTSQISWGNPDVMHGLRTMFAAKDNETIVSIEVTEVGISAEVKLR